jgi:phosphoglycerate dehydrogenase-like enzyme
MFAQLLEPATVLGLRRPLDFPFEPSLLDAAGGLQFIQKSGSGADWFDVDALNARGILLATNVGVNAPSVAEHAVLLTLLCLRGVFAPMQQMQRGVWDRMATTPPAVLLDGKTVGIIGTGFIGTRVARAMLGLGARVIATRPPREPLPEVAVLPLDDLLRQADVLTLHVPLNETTRGILGVRELALMKPSATIVNTSRGQVIDEAALYDALREGRLRAAGLDVFVEEPTPADNPLLSLPNVVTTPHIAGMAAETTARQLEATVDNIARFLTGKVPQRLINPELLEMPHLRASQLRQ